MIWKYVVNIYEPQGAGLDYPVVQHVFLGRTQKEAQGYFKAHLKTDEFLRKCYQRGRWNGADCVTESHWEHE